MEKKGESSFDSSKAELAGLKYFPKGEQSAPWRTNWWYFLIKLNMILTFFSLSIFTLAFSIITEFDSKAITFLVFAFFFVVFLFLLVIRHYTYQRWKLSDYMHRLTHDLRDMEVNCQNQQKKRSCAEMPSCCVFSLLSLHCDNFANYIEDYFSLLTQRIWLFHARDELRCVIRLKAIASNGQFCYCTTGRSGTNNISSKRITTPIPDNTGIFEALKGKDCQGVFICDDVSSAISLGYYKEAKDMKRNLQKTKSFMIAPINGSIDSEIDMIGTITVSTMIKNKVFRSSHVDIFRAFADFLGASLPSICRALYPNLSGALIKLPENLDLTYCQNCQCHDCPRKPIE